MIKLYVVYKKHFKEGCLKVKGRKMVCHVNSNQNCARVATLISEKVDDEKRQYQG